MFPSKKSVWLRAAHFEKNHGTRWVSGIVSTHSNGFTYRLRFEPAPSEAIPQAVGVGINTPRRFHSRRQRPRSFWSAPRIATSYQVQRHSVFDWLCKHNRLRPEPIRFVRLDSEHAQSDGKSVILAADQKERGLWGRE